MTGQCHHESCLWNSLVVQWLGLSTLAKKNKDFFWNLAKKFLECSQMLAFCCKVVPLFQDCSSGQQMSVAWFSASFITKFPQKTPQGNQRVQEKALISETWLPLSPKNVTCSLETKGSCQLREEHRAAHSRKNIPDRFSCLTSQLSSGPIPNARPSR